MTSISTQKCISGFGNYYIGEYKEDRRNGEGVEYFNEDKIYEGGWKDDEHYGQGTYYSNWDKYTGQWDGWKGHGKINYKDGKKYIGHWDYYDGDFKRHGLGTLYSADGQALNQGKWEWNEYKDKE